MAGVCTLGVALITQVIRTVTTKHLCAQVCACNSRCDTPRLISLLARMQRCATPLTIPLHFAATLRSWDNQLPENTCTAKADATEWATEGCVVAGTQNATTVSGLGTQTAAAGYLSCTITCPTDGGNFVVSAQGHATPCLVHSCTTHTTSHHTGPRHVMISTQHW